MSSSKLFGSTLIIAGTTIGAGMLALPLASAGIGFLTSLTIMFALWAMMAFTALLMIEIHQYADHNATLHTLAAQILGRKGQWIATFAMLFLFYSLCAAYIAGGGTQFTQRVFQFSGIELNALWGTFIFTLLVALIVTIGTASVDKVNRLLFTGKIITMVLVLSFLAPNVTQSYLLSMPLEQGLIVAAIPVIFTSFGFHGSIPAIVHYLEGDTPALRKAIIIGSALPLAVYIFWQLVTLGVISQSELTSHSGLNYLIGALSQKVQQSNLAYFIGLFADLALLTSFLGVSLGLFEFLADSLRRSKPSYSPLSFNSLTARLMATFATFSPPFVFAVFYPQGFIMALGYAAIALAILAIFLPLAMVIKVRRHTQEQYYKVMGGPLPLWISGLFGFIIIGVQILITFNVLPALG